uniref:hypothetical protein n=1 Tax=uncultured Erythrobacter sp. TaxID=263913 RepID=UPI0026029FEB|nr:hypothetical protein [uncultured Erythrobacter sp.]
MLQDSLIDEVVWSEAPSDAEEAFLFIVLAAKKKLDTKTAFSFEADHSDAFAWRQQFIVEIATIAEELGISGLPTASNAVNSTSTMDSFNVSLSRVVTRLRARNRELLRADSVALSPETKDKIRARIDRLRTAVGNSNLSEKAKERLHARIDAVEAELDKKRTNLVTFWLLAGAFTTATTGTAGFLADAGDAVETVEEVVEYVNESKANEVDDGPPLLEPPPLRLEYSDHAEASSEEEQGK